MLGKRALTRVNLMTVGPTRVEFWYHSGKKIASKLQNISRNDRSV